jgi:hypothetical protein
MKDTDEMECKDGKIQKKVDPAGGKFYSSKYIGFLYSHPIGCVRLSAT